MFQLSNLFRYIIIEREITHIFPWCFTASLLHNTSINSTFLLTYFSIIVYDNFILFTWFYRIYSYPSHSNKRDQPVQIIVKTHDFSNVRSRLFCQSLYPVLQDLLLTANMNEQSANQHVTGHVYKRRTDQSNDLMSVRHVIVIWHGIVER